MSATRHNLPAHISQQAQRVFALVRTRYGQESLRHLQRDTTKVAQHLGRVATDLYALADTSTEESLSARAAHQLETLAGRLSQLAADIERPFLLFVVGMGKFGKSTLINALVGRRVAAMDTLPKTWKIDVFTSTLPQDVAEIRKYDGHVQRIPVSEALRLIDAEERRREESEEKVWRLFQERTRTLATVAEKEELRRELELVHLYRSPIIEVRWPVPAGSVTSHFDVVDTPGLWQERPGRERTRRSSRAHGRGQTAVSAASDLDHAQTLSMVSSEDLRSYYGQADGVLWMLDATKLASGKPHELMEDLNTALDRVGGVAQNAVAVLNRMDLVRRNGGGDAVQRVVTQAEKLLGGLFQQVVPISAREALEALESGDAQRLEQSGLIDLLAVIDRRFRVSGTDVRWRAKLRSRADTLEEARGVRDAYRETLTAAQVELTKRAHAAERHLKSLAVQARERLSRALSDYQAAVNSRIESNARAVLSRKENERQDYLRHELFQVHHLRSVIGELMQETEHEYRRTVTALAPHQQFRTLKYVHPPTTAALAPLPAARALPDIYVHTGDLSLPDDLLVAGGLAVAGGAILGPIGIFVAPLLTGVVQDILGSPALNRLKKRLRDQLNEICRNIEQQWEDAVNQLDQQHRLHLQDVRERSFAQVHVQPDSIGAALKLLDEIGDYPLPRAPLPPLRDLMVVPWVKQKSTRTSSLSKEVAT